MIEKSIPRIRKFDYPSGIILDNITLYDSAGKPAIRYEGIVLYLEAVKNGGRYGSPEKYLQFSQNSWIDYFKLLGNNTTLPSLPVYYAVIERLQEESHPAAIDLLTAMRWGLCTNTRINYTRDVIIHGHGGCVNAAIPPTEGIIELDEVKNDKDWRLALQALLMPKDLDKALAVLQSFSRSPLRIMAPDAIGRTRITDRRGHEKIAERAVSLNISHGNFTFDMGLRPNSSYCNSLEMIIYDLH